MDTVLFEKIREGAKTPSVLEQRDNNYIWGFYSPCDFSLPKGEGSVINLGFIAVLPRDCRICQHIGIGLKKEIIIEYLPAVPSHTCSPLCAYVKNVTSDEVTVAAGELLVCLEFIFE